MLRFATAMAALAVICGGVAAETPRNLVPRSSGYDFSHPRVLVQQQLFGLAHGVELLTRACERDPRHGGAVRKAHADWHAWQGATIAQARAELARYYFGSQSDRAGWNDIAAALGLEPALSLKPGSRKYDAACATLPQALQEPRNDLTAILKEQGSLLRVAKAAYTAARAEACTAHDNSMSSRLADWHARHDAETAKAREYLQARWQDDGPENNVDALIARARRQGLAAGGDCARLARWLATAEADPGANFEKP